MIHGEYNAEQYTIFSTKNGQTQDIYSAGNSARESQTRVPADEGVGLDEMERMCEQTARQMAAERKEPFGGVEEAEVEENEDEGD